jgi:hypothetical protein
MVAARMKRDLADVHGAVARHGDLRRQRRLAERPFQAFDLAPDARAILR